MRVLIQSKKHAWVNWSTLLVDAYTLTTPRIRDGKKIGSNLGRLLIPDFSKLRPKLRRPGQISYKISGSV